jgi:hypothetical protein
MLTASVRRNIIILLPTEKRIAELDLGGTAVARMPEKT